MAKWFFSPSSQQANIVEGYNEELWNNQLTDIIIPIMERHGEECARNRMNETWKEHYERSNAWGADYHIALHTNAAGSGEWQDRADGPTVGCGDSTNPLRKGTILATFISEELAKIWPTTGRGVVTYTFAEITKTIAIAAYVENGYHDNKVDQAFLLGNKTKIAVAIVKGCLAMINKEYDGLEEKPVEQTYYRVQVGSFSNKTYADLMCAKAKEQGFSAARVFPTTILVKPL